MDEAILIIQKQLDQLLAKRKSLRNELDSLGSRDESL